MVVAAVPWARPGARFTIGHAGQRARLDHHLRRLPPPSGAAAAGAAGAAGSAGLSAATPAVGTAAAAGAAATAGATTARAVTRGMTGTPEPGDHREHRQHPPGNRHGWRAERGWGVGSLSTTSTVVLFAAILIPLIGISMQAFLRRFGLEHALSFLKQTLGWFSPKLRNPAATGAGPGWSSPRTPNYPWPVT